MKKNKKGQIAALLGLSSTVLITFMALVFLLIGILLFGTGLLLNYIKQNLLFIIGTFILIINTIMVVKTKKLNTLVVSLYIIGIVLIILNIFLSNYDLLTVVGA